MSSKKLKNLNQNIIEQDRIVNKRAKRWSEYLNVTQSDEDSFIAHERSIANSCKKNKENLFEKDKLVKSDTPRRETYTVDTPLKNLQTTNSPTVMAIATPKPLKGNDDEFINVTLSRGSERKGKKSKRKVSFVTPLRRSARINAATPLYNSVKDRPKTPMPTRLSSVEKHETLPNKKTDGVACNLNLDISLNMDSKSSIDSKKRPSTPMPLLKQNRRRLSSFGDSKNRVIPSVLESTPIVVQPLKELEEEDLVGESPSKTLEAGEGTRVKRSLTPKVGKIEKSFSKTPQNASIKKIGRAGRMSKSSKKCTPLPSFKSSQKASVQTPTVKSTQKITSTPLAIHSSNRSAVLTPGSKKAATPFLPSKRIGTPAPGCKKISTPSITKRIGTPNFNKIHQKAMNKMESIDDYQKRKAQNSIKKLQEQRKFHTPAKSNIPKKAVAEKMRKAPKIFSGIPFVPAAPPTRAMRNRFQASTESKAKAAISSKPKSLNERVLAKKLTTGNLKMMKMSLKQNENTPLKQKPKFDLRASLARKLPYKPHSGPLKPIADGNMNMSLNATALRSGKITENQVVKAMRIESRDVLKGVRKNKRFLLQMNNRQMDISVL